MPLSPTPSCAVCDTTTSTSKLFRCDACKIVHYCGRSHQLADRLGHKAACTSIKKTLDTLTRQEAQLRANPGDWMTPANLFDTQVGHFWGILDTRPYMRARFAHIEAMLSVKNYLAVEKAHEHVMDILRLNRSDNMGVRDLAPVLKLRLGRDQECYDFCKWYATSGQDSHYDWGNMELPFLDVRGANVLEPVRAVMTSFPDLSHIVALALLKIRVLLDVRALHNSEVIGSKVPQEILNNVRGELVSGSLLVENKSLLKTQNQTALILCLETQVEELYNTVEKENKYFWEALLEPGGHLEAKPEYYSSGSVEQMQVTLKFSYDAWVETPGAVELIEHIMEEV